MSLVTFKPLKSDLSSGSPSLDPPLGDGEILISIKQFGCAAAKSHLGTKKVIPTPYFRISAGGRKPPAHTSVEFHVGLRRVSCGYDVSCSEYEHVFEVGD